MQDGSFGLAAVPSKQTTATLSLVSGCLAFVAVWIPIASLLSWVLAPAGLFFGLLTLGRHSGSRPAKVGIGLSLLALAGCLAWIFIFNSSFTARPSHPGEQGVTYSVQKEPRPLVP